MHEWKDYVSNADMDAVKDDPLWEAYEAGFRKSREIYGRGAQVTNIVPPSNPLHYYLWWKESKNANP